MREEQLLGTAVRQVAIQSYFGSTGIACVVAINFIDRFRSNSHPTGSIRPTVIGLIGKSRATATRSALVTALIFASSSSKLEYDPCSIQCRPSRCIPSPGRSAPSVAAVAMRLRSRSRSSSVIESTSPAIC